MALTKAMANEGGPTNPRQRDAGRPDRQRSMVKRHAARRRMPISAPSRANLPKAFRSAHGHGGGIRQPRLRLASSRLVHHGTAIMRWRPVTV